jgi:hypothetical protein
MFRGGRVDSRGTGIASGLGYAGGGSVNTPRRGFVTGPGGYAGIPQHKTGAEIIEEVYAKPWLPYLGKRLPPRSVGTTGTGEASGVNTTDEFIPNPKRIIRGVVVGGGVKKNPNYKPPTRTVERNVRGSKSTAQQPLTKEEIAFTEGDFHPGQAELWRDPGDTSGTGNGDGGAGTPEKTKAEKLAEYQEMFEKAYGTGRGDDISTMLLSYAGKALKPEATVKSSFGEFFEDEAKRPSESKKYKDAATTAAINAFLSGEKDFSTFMNQMKATEHAVDYKNLAEIKAATNLKKTWNLNDYVINKKAGTSKMEALEGGIRDKIKLNPEYTGFKKIKSKENKEDLITDEYLGIIFMDQGTREVFAVVLGENNTPIKQILYGV